MTLFDDEIPDTPGPVRPRWVRVLRKLCLAALICGIMLWISLRLLMTMGGNQPELRQGLEAYFQGLTGLPAKIGGFKGATFYPVVSADMSEIDFFAPPAPPAAGQAKGAVRLLPYTGAPVAAIGEMKVALNFWDIIFSRGHMNELTVTDIDFGGKLGLPRPVRVSSFRLEKTPAPLLTARGKYGEDDFTLATTMAWHDDGDGRGYFFRPDDAALTFVSPFLTVAGRVESGRRGHMRIALKRLAAPGLDMAGFVDVGRRGRDYTFDGVLQGGVSRFVFSLLTGARGITGRLHASVLALEDVETVQAAFRLAALLTPAGMAIGKLDVAADRVTWRGRDLGHVALPLTAGPQGLTLGPASGTLLSGAVSGQAVLSGPVGDLRSLDVRLAVRDMVYGGGGRAVLTVGAKGQGRDAADAARHLAGDALLVAAGGTLPADLFDREAALPGAAATPGCFLVHARLGEGRATVAPFRLDAPHLGATGGLDLANGQLDLTLIPAAGRRAVHVTGPLLSPHMTPVAKPLPPPSFAPPVLTAFSAAEGGLASGHPCAAPPAAP